MLVMMMVVLDIYVDASIPFSDASCQWFQTIARLKGLPQVYGALRQLGDNLPDLQYNAGLFVSSVHLSYWTISIPNCLKPYDDSIEWSSTI